ncbi:hypothetical protein SLS62_006713 [Diatrype stigma]|uniref:Uncharacterized protein n=1 Tax=Diatrype stigma TaxID=117547 RepID=A0AAN9YQY4_9PEZI
MVEDWAYPSFTELPSMMPWVQGDSLVLRSARARPCAGRGPDGHSQQLYEVGAVSPGDWHRVVLQARWQKRRDRHLPSLAGRQAEARRRGRHHHHHLRRRREGPPLPSSASGQQLARRWEASGFG